MKTIRDYRFVLTVMNYEAKPELFREMGEFIYASKDLRKCENAILASIKDADERGAREDYYNYKYCIYKETEEMTILVETITIDEVGITIK